MSNTNESARLGLSSWSINHPVGVAAIALAIIILGLFSLNRIPVDLLPHLIYPEVRVRINDTGTPAPIIEDRITRQLEEQLAITEGVVAVNSRSVEGNSSVDLSFPYGHNIDQALADASTRLDRAKRFLPDTISPPTIYKRDPSQIPVAEYIVSSSIRQSASLREWIDYDFAKRLITVAGVASTEVGGGVTREIVITPKPLKMANHGIELDTIKQVINNYNVDRSTGRLQLSNLEIGTRLNSRFNSVEAIAMLPVPLKTGSTIPLHTIASVIDSHSEERLMVRFNGEQGVKLSIQKQPEANSVDVVDGVNQRIQWLREQNLIPDDITIEPVSDQATFVRSALQSTQLAALSGVVLAMIVVYLFLGDMRRTLIIGTAIPFALVVTFSIMDINNLTLNIMSLGGVALGIGLLLDNTIVMLENIHRHQQQGTSFVQGAIDAATEIQSAIVAATSTNLAALLPFLFISGLVGLLFKELLLTIAAAVIASLLISLTLVPALAARIHRHAKHNIFRRTVDKAISKLQSGYGKLLHHFLVSRFLQTVFIALLSLGLYLTIPVLNQGVAQFLPQFDNGEVTIRIYSDPGTPLTQMNAAVDSIEQILSNDANVKNYAVIVGGYIFGRSSYERSNSSYMTIKLKPSNERQLSMEAWITQIKKEVATLKLIAIKVRISPTGIRGIRLSQGDDDLSLRVQGSDLPTLKRIADKLVEKVSSVKGLRNITHSAEDFRQQLELIPNPLRLAEVGMSADALADKVQLAISGEVITDYLEGDRAYPVRLRFAQPEHTDPSVLNELIISDNQGRPIKLNDVAQLKITATPSEIRRADQQRIVEVSASISSEASALDIYADVNKIIESMELPQGYTIYDGGGQELLQEGKRNGQVLLMLAIFLVFVVMAVQYESIRNPLIILMAIPFTVIGVVYGIQFAVLPLSMPVILGIIMLTGIVVNNAILLVEYFEIKRNECAELVDAIVIASKLRLRPILMTTLTTVFGMLPLALNLNEGGEMLQPLAITMISGLSASLLITLFLIPMLYKVFSAKNQVC